MGRSVKRTTISAVKAAHDMALLQGQCVAIMDDHGNVEVYRALGPRVRRYLPWLRRHATHIATKRREEPNRLYVLIPTQGWRYVESSRFWKTPFDALIAQVYEGKRKGAG